MFLPRPRFLSFVQGISWKKQPCAKHLSGNPTIHVNDGRVFFYKANGLISKQRQRSIPKARAQLSSPKRRLVHSNHKAQSPLPRRFTIRISIPPTLLHQVQIPTMKTSSTLLLFAATSSLTHAARIGLLRMGNLPQTGRHLGVAPKYSAFSSALFDEDLQS